MGLLKGIHPLLTADLLHILRSMGHGDEILVCDCNFPAASISKETVSHKHIVLTCTLPEALNAICSVMPLDYFQKTQCVYMAPEQGLELPSDGIAVLDQCTASILEHSNPKLEAVDRFQFYKYAKKVYAIVQTMERRPYANFVLKKGCIGPDGKDLLPSPVIKF
jgi:L-fucose mutarotase